MLAKNNLQIVVRFPPSPTGEIHIGNVRTLLFNYLFARKNNGKIVFRFEDTDKERSKKEFEQPMLDAFHNLGLNWDEGPYRQSDRTEIYKKYLQELVQRGLAYEDVENATKTGKIVRLKNIEREIKWIDLVKGEIKINTHTFKERDDKGDGSRNFTGENAADIIIARSIDDPIYHFTVVVDDWLMGVTHVIRGDDHITSTPRQIMILEALQQLHTGPTGVVIPQYAHLPTIIGDDRKKLSKRDGNTSLQSFFDMGYLKETMINYLALLGWNPGDEREFFTLDQLVEEFSLERCLVSPAQFDFRKLNSINKYYLAKLSDQEFVKGVYEAFPTDSREVIDKDFEKFKKITLKVYRERISKFKEVYEAVMNGENDMFHNFSYDNDLKTFDLNKICFKNKERVQSLDEAKANLKLVLAKLEELLLVQSAWTVENLKNELWDWSATIGRGQILHPLRMVMSLKEKSPDPFTIMEIIGKDESLRRLNIFLK